MSTPDAIGEVWHTYQVTVNCLEVTLDDLRLGRMDSLQGTGFMDIPIDAVRRNIQASRETLDDHTILAMWAVFEQEMIAILEIEAHKMLGIAPSAFNQAVLSKIEAGIGRWQGDEMIDLFKPLFSVELIAYTKQIKRYRNWVAHRNIKKPSPKKVTPEFAYDILAVALQKMRQS
jgi:hypothetical protein